MASAETTTAPIRENLPGKADSESGETAGWKPSAIAADIATMGTGTLLAGLFNVALVFVVPKLISVEDYGYWRMFGLYAGYVGFLHFGFADGALLRWAGRPFEEFRAEVRPALKYLLWQHAIVLAPLCAIALLVLPGPLRFVGVAIAIHAVVFNVVTVQQYSLQAARIFRPVAISAAAAPGLFLVLAFAWRYRWQSDYREVTSFYVAGWLIVLLFLLTRTRPWSGPRREVSAIRLAKDCVLSGWPMVMANTGVMLIAFADRLAVSWSATIQNFAQYSLAASAMSVPITAIQACSKVFFPHLAGVGLERRKRVYGISLRTLLFAWAILLPYYFALDVFIRHFLPKYFPSLAYARILLLGIPFLAAILILQMSYAYLHQMQKPFLVRTVAVLIVSIGITSFTAFHVGSLQIVAAVQVAILGAWWLFNEWTLRELTGETPSGWVKFLWIYGLASLAYWLATGWTGHSTVSVLAYYACLATVLIAFCREDVRVWIRLVPRGRAA
jgi:O-antigen/teichoic acid export membrane protein